MRRLLLPALWLILVVASKAAGRPPALLGVAITVDEPLILGHGDWILSYLVRPKIYAMHRPFVVASLGVIARLRPVFLLRAHPELARLNRNPTVAGQTRISRLPEGFCGAQTDAEINGQGLPGIENSQYPSHQPLIARVTGTIVQRPEVSRDRPKESGAAGLLGQPCSGT